MSLLESIFGYAPIRKLQPEPKREVQRLLDELINIGKTDDYLSLQPGGPFNIRCHHTRAKQIGVRLDEIGGLELMTAARAIVKRKLKATLAEHLDYCWQDVGKWQP